MEKEGKLITCDRCHEQVFLERDESKDVSRDGGFTQYKGFQPIPNGWARRLDRNLCPDCNAYFAEVIADFFNNEKKS